MSEMLITIPEEKRTVIDYDLIFSSGMLLPFTIDLTLGDKILVGEKLVLIHLEPKPSRTDATKNSLKEDITVFTNHLVCIQTREREITEPTQEQRKTWEKTIQQMSGTVQ